jgi:pheromone shutdown protein TraB
MGSLGMVTILGTGHVFDLRARVQSEIYRRMPTAVAVELDATRYKALRVPRDQRGKGPFLYQKLADFQNRIAEAYGVEAGDDMLAAADAAKQMAVPLMLIDRDAQVTFKRLIKETPFLEKMKLLGSVVGSVFVPAKSIDAQVQEMEKDYSRYFEELANKFPTLKRVLLDERNVHMANAIRELSAEHPDLVAVLGDGHVDGVVDILKEAGLDVDVLRLKDLRGPLEEDADTASVDLSYRVSDAPAPEHERGGLDQ